jgi:hypothetical protein
MEVVAQQVAWEWVVWVATAEGMVVVAEVEVEMETAKVAWEWVVWAERAWEDRVVEPLQALLHTQGTIGT